MFPSSNLPTNLASSPADTPHVNASAHLKVSVNGNTPSGPNTLVSPTAGSKVHLNL